MPNFAEGRHGDAIDAIRRALGASVVDVHVDSDHNRSVFTLTGRPGELAHLVSHGAREALQYLDIGRHQGAHPRVGALDVAPIVFLSEAERGAACAEALVLGDLLGEELAIPVFLYGELGGGRTRAELRRGGPDGLGQRLGAGELEPDFGPPRLHPRAGATLVGARPPLVAFNLELAAPAGVEDAQRIAAAIREGGEAGLHGLRAIGLWLAEKSIAQVSTNVEDPYATPLADVVRAVRRHAELVGAELVGLAPRAAFEGFPDDVDVRGKKVLEDVLGGLD